MSVAEYLDLPAEDLTPEVYSCLIKLSEDDDNLDEFERLWHADDISSMDDQRSKSIWHQISDRLNDDHVIAANEAMEPVSDYSYSVA